MVGTILNTMCVHGKKLMDCRRCTDIEEFNTDLDDETGPIKWIMTLDDIPAYQGPEGREIQLADYEDNGIRAIVRDEENEASYAN